MKKLVITFITIAIAAAATTAHALSYDMQGGLSNPQDCNIADSYWRSDEVTYDAWGSYSDPYSYGGLPHSDLSYPLREYAGANDMYYGGTGNQYGSSQVTYDAYNSYGDDYYDYSQSNYYGQGGSMYGDDYSVDAIAAANLQTAMSRGTVRGAATSGTGTGGSGGGVRVAQNTGTVVDTTSRSTGPKCTLIPRSTGSNSVVLEWQTVGASSAFIDNGVGHVVLGSGTRMVTPRVTTTYNMTVVDGRGFSSQCAAIVHVLGSGKVEATGTTIVPAPGTTSGVQTDAVNGGVDGTTVNSNGPLNETAQKITGNVSEKVTSVLSSGESIWNKMRQMSLVAIGLFFIIFIIIFVMKKMFGGGDEGHH